MTTTTTQIIKDGGLIKVSTEVYEDDIAIEKLALAMAFNEVIGQSGTKTIRIDTFVKTRCKHDGKKGLTEAQITDAADRAEKTIEAAREGDREANEQKQAELARVPHIPEEIRQKAREIYESGKLIEYGKDVFRKVWLGDSFILQAIFYVNGTYFVDNPNEPVHLHISGGTQAGKTESAKMALRFIPPRYYLIATATPKALHYDGGQYTHPEMMILWDEGLTEDTRTTLRSYLTSWEKGTELLTVVTENGKRKTIKVKIPPKINLILTVQDGIYDESDEAQDESRLLKIELKRSPEQERQIIQFVQDQEKKPEDIGKELEILHAAWTIMPRGKITLHRDFSMDDANVKTIREFKRFMTILKVNALLHNRTTTTEADVLDVRQFLTYSKPMLSSTQAARANNEATLLQHLRSDRWQSAYDLQQASGLSYRQTERALHGRDGTFRSPTGGLLNDKRVLMQYEKEIQTFTFKLKS